MKFLTALLFFFIIAFLFPSFSQTLASSTWQKYPSNPIFEPGPQGSWDSRHVANASVLKENSLYKMWYQGSDGATWKIGFATSPDGVSNWTRNNQPVIEIGSSDGWEATIESPVVIYNASLEKYQMWYSSVKSSWVSGSDRFRLRYAESSDGLNWVRFNDWVLKGTLENWDAGGPDRGSSVIYKDGVYHLWYAATNNGDLIGNPFWRIGYATSSDGKVWVKQNEGLPVIEPTETWELNNVSFPSVIYESGIYHMWYAAGAGDAPTQVVYAQSPDGVHWQKTNGDNPVFSITSNGFDSRNITSTHVVNDNGIYKMWYSGLDGSNWKIGLATTSVLPSHTPTPSPEPTATPTPMPTTKIVVIPGLGASWNADLLFNCQPGSGNEEWTLNKLAEKVYDGLIQKLQDPTHMVIPFYYDWRRTPTQNASQLYSLINSNVSDGEKVDVIGHSMGGLVARAYIEQRQDESSIDALLAVGSPFGGSANAYPVWEGAQIAQNNLLVRFALNAVINFCGLTHNVSKLEAVHTYAPSIRKLLPASDYLRQKSTNAIKPEAEMFYRNEWLPNNFFTPPYHGIRVGTLAGTGYKTLMEIKVNPPNRKQVEAGLWKDGKPVTNVFTVLGDGTVLLSSAQLPNADNRTITLNHSGLVSNNRGIDAILDFFGYTPSAFSLSTMSVANELTSQAEPESALILMAYQASFEVENPDKTVLKDENGMIAIANPKTGTRKIRLYPRSETTRFVVAQLLKNGNTLWKEYKIKGKAPKIKNIIFDEIYPLEDPLK